MVNHMVECLAAILVAENKNSIKQCLDSGSFIAWSCLAWRDERLC